MPISEFPAFLRKHKNVRHAVIYCAVSCVLLLVQFFLMKKNPLNVLFDVIIPITAAFTFGCYAITMAMDRPVILICPPTVYFVSLLITQLISVEVGVEDTYPIFTFIELVPYLFFCISVSTDKLKRFTDKIIKAGCVLTLATALAITILSIFFDITLFRSNVHHIARTFGFACGLLAVLCIYLAMIELLKISGCDKRIRPKRMKTIKRKKNKKAQTEQN